MHQGEGVLLSPFLLGNEKCSFPLMTCGCSLLPSGLLSALGRPFSG